MNDLIAVLQRTLYPDARPDSVQLVLDYCAARGLDPMLKPVHLVPMKGRDNQWRDTVMPGIGLYRIMAARSNDYAGMDRPVFEDVASRKVGSRELVCPAACTVTVYRMVAGQRVAFCATEYWLENYAAGKDGETPNAMWTKRPFGQLAKCAEAQALRRAWPEVGQTPVAEEMEGRAEVAAVDHEPVQVIEQAMAAVEQKPQAPQEQQALVAEASAEPPAKRDDATVLRDILCSFESSPDTDTLRLAGDESAGAIHALPEAMQKQAKAAYKAQQDKLGQLDRANKLKKEAAKLRDMP